LRVADPGLAYARHVPTISSGEESEHETSEEVALALAATIFAVTFAACGALQPASGTISGVAHGAKHWNSPDTGPPIAGRQITLLNADDGSIVKSVSTDAQGRFTFTVAPGDYSIWGGERARSHPRRIREDHYGGDHCPRGVSLIPARP
jgi:hypothetical protein